MISVDANVDMRYKFSIRFHMNYIIILRNVFCHRNLYAPFLENTDIYYLRKHGSTEKGDQSKYSLTSIEYTKQQ